MSANDLLWYDCNVAIGRPQTGCYAPLTSAQALLDALDWVGVQQALVHHVLMQSQSPVVGNRVLTEALVEVDSPRLTPSWAILPPQTGELGASQAFFAAMANHGVKALWAFPLDHRYLLNRLTFGAFLDEVSARHIPLLLPRKAGGELPHQTYELLTRLLAEYPDLRVVLAASGAWGEDRFFRPFLEHYRHFYLDISFYELDCGLHDLVARYGADRLLYGSNCPTNSMGGPRMMVSCADIDKASRAAIAGGNLTRLLEEVQL